MSDHARNAQLSDAENAARQMLLCLFDHNRPYPFLNMDSPFWDTPQRFVKALVELTTAEEFNFTTFPSESDEMVVVQDIPFVTLCAHHVLPFTGVAHIGYVPNGCIAGLSKLARTVAYFSKGLNVQEELTRDIADYLEEKLQPKGVAVIMEAEHTCMTIRGIKANGSRTTTSVMRGVFADHDRLARQEFMGLIGK